MCRWIPSQQDNGARSSGNTSPTTWRSALGAADFGTEAETDPHLIKWRRVILAPTSVPALRGRIEVDTAWFRNRLSASRNRTALPRPLSQPQ
jgi:hypothetical protein